MFFQSGNKMSEEQEKKKPLSLRSSKLQRTKAAEKIAATYETTDVWWWLKIGPAIFGFAFL